MGLNGLVVKTHGSSKAKEVCNSIIQCAAFKEQQISEKIRISIEAASEEKRKIKSGKESKSWNLKNYRKSLQRL